MPCSLTCSKHPPERLPKLQAPHFQKLSVPNEHNSAAPSEGQAKSAEQLWDFPNRCSWGAHGLRNRARRTPATSEQAPGVPTACCTLGISRWPPWSESQCVFAIFAESVCIVLKRLMQPTVFSTASPFLHNRDWSSPIRNGFHGFRLPSKHRPLSYVTKSTKMPKVKAALGFVQTYPSKSSHPFELRAVSNNEAYYW